MLNFRTFSLPFKKGGSTTFHAGSMWPASNSRFVLAKSQMTQQEAFLGEPKPESVLQIMQSHWLNYSHHSGMVRNATPDEAREFMRLFGSDSCVEHGRIVCGNSLLDCTGGLTPFNTPQGCIGRSKFDYREPYFRHEFELLLVIDQRQ